MEVFINQQLTQIPEKASLDKVMLDRGFNSPKGVAVAVNDEVIPHTDWETHSLLPQDNITIIRATQGG